MKNFEDMSNRIESAEKKAEMLEKFYKNCF